MSLCSKKLRFSSTWEELIEEGEEGGEVGEEGLRISVTVVRRKSPLSSGLHKLSLKQWRFPTTRNTTIMKSLCNCSSEAERDDEGVEEVEKSASRVEGGEERSWRRSGVARAMTSFLKFESSERISISLKESSTEGPHMEGSRMREDICVTVLIIVCMC